MGAKVMGYTEYKEGGVDKVKLRMLYLDVNGQPTNDPEDNKILRMNKSEVDTEEKIKTILNQFSQERKTKKPQEKRNFLYMTVDDSGRVV